MTKINDNLYTIVNKKQGNNVFCLVKNNRVIAIDPSWADEEISKFVLDNHYGLEAIILTHGHFDHIGNTFKLAKEFKCKVYLHAAEKKVAFEENFSSPEFPIYPIDESTLVLVNDSTLKIGDFEFKLVLTPGHTCGGMAVNYENYWFVGDDIFYNGVGRSDLMHSNTDDLVKSLKKLDKMIKNDDLVLTGHGPNATYGQIKKVNKMLNDYLAR